MMIHTAHQLDIIMANLDVKQEKLVSQVPALVQLQAKPNKQRQLKTTLPALFHDTKSNR